MSYCICWSDWSQTLPTPGQAQERCEGSWLSSWACLDKGIFCQLAECVCFLPCYKFHHRLVTVALLISTFTNDIETLSSFNLSMITYYSRPILLAIPEKACCCHFISVHVLAQTFRHSRHIFYIVFSFSVLFCILHSLLLFIFDWWWLQYSFWTYVSKDKFSFLASIIIFSPNVICWLSQV